MLAAEDKQNALFDKRLAQEEKTESARQKQLERELEWVQMSPRARQAKGKARLAAYENLLEADPDRREAVLVPDVNHYTILMGGGHGPRRIAAILAELASGNRAG